ncbi:MAG: tRNA adenosine(34) deaminase TadA [Planctomycetota bacterium]
MNGGLMELASQHREFMKAALREARLALDHGDVPVGAVVVRADRIIARGHNQRELLKDPTAHAEMIAITSAAAEVGDWRLEDCDLYVTLEPCPMCASAIQQARLRRLVFGAPDPVMGACGSRLMIPADKRLGKPIEIIAPVMMEECSLLLGEFFASIRNPK